MSKDSLLGLRLSNYEIKQQIGHGGMAKVYYAVDVNLERPAAVKVIDTRFRGDPEYARRFIDEAKTVATWRHENIIQVYYADQVDEIYFFAMEYIDGASMGELLDAYMDDGELMPHEDALRIGRRVASALDYAHEKGVIHRDIKPSNVMIASDDRVILTDFGLALDVEQGSLGEIFGTPHYASPEQARRSSDAVPQSDVYSFGVMLYEILTGVVPFDDESVTAIAVQHLSEDPPPPRSLNPQLNEATETVLLKALAKRPEDRYATATALIDALEDALQQPAAKNPAPPPVMPPAALDAARKSKAGGKLSAMSVAQKMAQQIEQRPQPPGSPVAPQKAKKRPQHADKTVKQSAGRSRTPLRIILVLLLVLAGLALAAGSGAINVDERLAFLSGWMSPNDTTPAAIAQEATTASMTPVATGTAVSVTARPNTPTSTIQQVTDAPTLTAIITNTSTPLPTFTPPPPTATTAASATPLRLPTRTPVPPTAAALPDSGTPVRYPNGRTLELYWNNDSFYVHNTTNGSIRISPLSFEAIGADGNRLSRSSFSGTRWTQFWHSIESDRCNGIEEGGDSNPLRPGACRGYNARLLPQDGEMFWTGAQGSSAFALLWNGEEIARCRIEAGVCAVNVPPG